jgi:hypothetical protein
VIVGDKSRYRNVKRGRGVGESQLDREGHCTGASMLLRTKWTLYCKAAVHQLREVIVTGVMHHATMDMEGWWGVIGDDR